ncbi:hypothetical protein [uncultured Eubacterium sp.]|uniref:hypothetical protein n=1 Tax=uncultured Eubacterium sp. TaxID=165185 RepID=UPI0025E2F04F|nr:hypothetical protein [uncultured Eubacterium sp.]
MAQIISELTKQRFEKQGLNLNNLVKSHFNCDDIIDLLNTYDVEQTVADSYDDSQNLDFCTWQDCDYVGNWSSTQEELNESFLDNMKFINETVKRSNISIDGYFYIYRDKYQMILYFPLRLVENANLDDYLFVLTDKSRIVMPLIALRNKNVLYNAIETAVEESTYISFREEFNLLISEGFLKSCGTMPDFGIVFTIDNLLWTDKFHNVYKSIIAPDWKGKIKTPSVSLYSKSFIVVGSLTPDGFSSGNVDMFKADNRYKTII